MTIETKKICISDRIWNYIQAGIQSGLFKPEITEKEKVVIKEVYRVIRGSEVLNGLNPQVVATFVLWYGCQIACSLIEVKWRYNPDDREVDPYRTVADVNLAMRRKAKRSIGGEARQRLLREFQNEFNDMITRYQSTSPHYIWNADKYRIEYPGLRYTD